MKRIRETLETAWNATRYSFAFCFRNNKRDTIVEVILLTLQTIIGYLAILIMGQLISSLQGHITGNNPSSFTLTDFVKGGYFFPVIILVTILFAEIVIQKFKSFISARRRHVLRVANTAEINALRASLDIARIRSKDFDDIEKKIDELPEGWNTRISFSNEVMYLLGEVVTFTIFGVSLFLTHPYYVMIIAITALPMALAESSAVNRAWKLSLELIPHHKKRGVLQRVYYSTTAFLQGVMFDQMGKLAEQIQGNQDEVIDKYNKLRWSNVKTSLGAYLIAMAGLSFILLHSVWNTVSIGGDLGALTVIIASSRRLQSSTRDIVLQIANQWLSARGMIIIEKEFFGMKPLLKTTDPIVPTFFGPPTIRFEGVCFSYPDKGTSVLKGVSFAIKPGSIVTIIGQNGSGKSSLIGLLLRHYDPTSGTITVDGIPLHRITPSTWSRHACALLQQFVVHERTIGEEIASSDLDAPLDQRKIDGACRFAGFAQIVEQDPKGYNSQIGTEFGGREFSGGEEQRLALARARYRNTPVLILDEPDARLDPEAAHRLMEQVNALRGNTTVIMVTQHVSRMRGDYIIVLSKGEVAEQGTHEELIALNGKYASMFREDAPSGRNS